MKTDQGLNPSGKAKLMEGAIHCIAQYGIAGATVRRIAEFSGVTIGLVRHHFGSKEKLLVACYQDLNLTAIAQIQAIEVTPDQSFKETMEQVVAALIPQAYHSQDVMQVLVAFWGSSLANSDFADEKEENNTRISEAIYPLFLQYTDDPKDAEFLTTSVIALMDGFWIECCFNSETMPPAKAIALAQRFCTQAIAAPCFREFPKPL